MLSEYQADKPLSPARRMEVFLAVVNSPDRQMTMTQSRTEVAERFGISERQVRWIEQEGLECEWPLCTG